MCRIWKIITFLEFLSQGQRSDILLSKIEALLIFDPLITLWGHFKTPYFKMLNDARLASACLYVRTCQRVRNSKNIATIRDFHLPSSFFCLSTRLYSLMEKLLVGATTTVCNYWLMPTKARGLMFNPRALQTHSTQFFSSTLFYFLFSGCPYLFLSRDGLIPSSPIHTIVSVTSGYG